MEIFTEHGGQSLSGLEELAGRDGIVLGGVHGDVDERFLEGVEESTSGGTTAVEAIAGSYCSIGFLETVHDTFGSSSAREENNRRTGMKKRSTRWRGYVVKGLGGAKSSPFHDRQRNNDPSHVPLIAVWCGALASLRARRPWTVSGSMLCHS